MKIYILDSNYDKLGYIDEADSILWVKRFNDVGECEVYISANDLMFRYLQVGNYIYREDDDMICKIEDVEIETDVENGDYIIAKGKDMSNIFAGRIIRWEITYSGKVCNYIKKLIVDNVITPAQPKRAINNVVFNDDNFSEFKETIEVKAFTDDLLETILSTCKTFNYGFKVKYLPDTKTLEFSLYKGKNKARITSDEYVEFSPTYSNIISTNYKEDETNYKNICYVGYKDSNDETILLSVFNTDVEPEGEERREIYVDGTSVSKEITEEELFEMFGDVTYEDGKYYALIAKQEFNEDGFIVTNYYNTHIATVDGDKITVTDYTYLLLIKILGLTTLDEYNKKIEFVGEVDTIDTYKYKTDYDLGDVVKVIDKYGIEAEATITEVMESEDNDDGYVVEPTFKF